MGSLLAHWKSIRKEQSVASILGSLLRQIVGGMERVPEGILRAFEEQKKVIGGRELRLLDIVKMLQTITSSLPTFALEYVLTLWTSVLPAVPSVQDGVRTTKDETISSLDRADGRRLQTRKSAQRDKRASYQGWQSDCRRRPPDEDDSRPAGRLGALSKIQVVVYERKIHRLP